MKSMNPTTKMRCPNCGRRAFDISKIPQEEVEITLKCPQCNRFVTIPCNTAWVIKPTADTQRASTGGANMR